MEVVHQGEVAGVWPRQTRCNNCVAVLNVDLADIYGVNSGAPDYLVWWNYDCGFCDQVQAAPSRWWAEVAAVNPAPPPPEQSDPEASLADGSGAPTE